ncbi:MAG: hypothetical protein O7C75_00485 [Verrucomicrobia bacterium]|nr:hypothetical protein [Verrucomicrobiota bacterium]
MGKLSTIACILAGPVLVYSGLIYYYGVNFPFLDDYDTILAHLLLPAGEQIANWFSPHNEHIHWVLRATASLDAKLFGEVNLVRLMWVGEVFFILFYLIFISSIQQRNIPWLWLIPLPLFLFQPSYWGTVTWATTSLHNFPGILFAFSAFFLWAQPKPWQKGCAILFLISALFTHGFGLAALIAVLLWEGHALYISFRNRPRTIVSPSLVRISILLVVLSLWILFKTNLTGPSGTESLETLDIFQATHFITNFIGSCIHFLGAPWITILALIEIGLLVWLTKKGLARKNPELYFFILYLFLCAALTTIARADMGPKQGLASRYRIFSTLLICSQYLGFVQLYWKKWSRLPHFFPSTLGLALLFYGYSLFVNTNNLNKIRVRLIEDRIRWIEGGDLQEYPDADRANRILTDAEKSGVFSVRDTQ